MNSVRKALVYNTAVTYFSLASNFVVLAVISRLLTPAEIGISVTGSAVVVLAVSLREFASSQFLIQRVELSRQDIRAAFTVMLTLTSLIALALVFAAPTIAYAYGESGLVLYLYVLSAAILVEVMAAPAIALMQREMAFGHVALVTGASTVASAGTTIGLALLGFSYMSLAWAWLISAVLGGVLAVWLRQQFWTLVPIFTNWRDMLTFGSYNGLNVALYRVYEQVPYVVLGRFLGLDAAALFHRTLAVAKLPDKVFLEGALSVVFPAFSREVRNGGNLKRSYLLAVGYITVVQWPALLVLAILAHPIILILVGDQWLAVVPLVRIVAIASLFSFSFSLNYSVLLSFGAVREIFVRSLIIWPTSALLLLAGTPFGLYGVATSLLFAIPLQAWVSLHFVRRHISVSWRELALAVWKSAVVTASTAAGPLFVVIATESLAISPLWGVGASVLGGIGWILGIWAVQHPALQELERARRLLTLPGMARRQAG